MNVDRRQVLRVCAVAGIGTIAGCGGDDQNNANEQSPTRDRNGPWASGEPTQLSKIAPDDGDRDDEFGIAAAASGDGKTVLIGAANDENPNGTDGKYLGGAGAVYVFEYAGDSWSQQAKLAADDGDKEDQFGTSLALSEDGTTAVVGAPNDEDPNGTDGGSAYVFDGSDGSWAQDTKLVSSNGTDHAYFGESVAVSGDGTTVLVGAPGQGHSESLARGYTYVFDGTGGSWSRQTKLSTADAGGSSDFCFDVSLSNDGTTALVGAKTDGSVGRSAGSAFIFTYVDGSWTQQTQLTADDGDNNDRFGSSVSLSGDGTTALIGAVEDEDPNGEQAGSAYIFSNDSGTWTQQTKPSASDGDAIDEFGGDTGLSNDGKTALIGAEFDEDPNGGGDEDYSGAGSVYLFDGSGEAWSQQTKLAADDGDKEDHFGSAVALSGDGKLASIGAEHDKDPNGDKAGSAYIFSV